jgi:hypothetical protein
VAAPDPSEIAQVAAQYSIPPAILYAVGEVESGYSDAVISGQQTSSAGAVGAFQFMPATAQAYGVSVQQLAGNYSLQLNLAARMLHDLFERYGSWQGALSAYNSGSPTAATGYASQVLGVAAKDPGYGMGSQGADGGVGTAGAQGSSSGYAPSDLAFWRGASGDFTNTLQGMTSSGGVVTQGALDSYRQQASQVSQGSPGHGGEGLSGFNGQCVGWVEQVLPWVPYGPATAAGYAAALPQVPGVRQSSAAGAQPGDVVVFAPGQAGADSTDGHIAVVTGVSANGDIQVSQANWDENGQPSVMTIPAATAQGLSFFSPPPQDVQASAQAAVASVQAAQGAGGVSSLSEPGSPQQATQASSTQQVQANEPDAQLVQAFAQEAQANGIDPQHLTDNISTAIALMRYVTGKDTMSLADYGPVSGMDPSAMLDYFRSLPHGTYPGLTSGQFMDTAHAASIPSLQYQSRQPEAAEVARFASAGYTPQMMNQYYQQTAKSGAGPTSIATAETYSTTHGGSGIRSE